MPATCGTSSLAQKAHKWCSSGPCPGKYGAFLCFTHWVTTQLESFKGISESFGTILRLRNWSVRGKIFFLPENPEIQFYCRESRVSHEWKSLDYFLLTSCEDSFTSTPCPPHSGDPWESRDFEGAPNYPVHVILHRNTRGRQPTYNPVSGPHCVSAVLKGWSSASGSGGGITWLLIRPAKSQAPSQTYRIRND